MNGKKAKCITFDGSPRKPEGDNHLPTDAKLNFPESFRKVSDDEAITKMVDVITRESPTKGAFIHNLLESSSGA